MNETRGEITMGNQVNRDNYEHKALLFAERYGVIDYEVVDNMMTYFDKHKEGQGVIAEYVSTVNLDSNQETRTQIQ